MRINPPKAIIDPQDPFKHALFGRKVFAESLTNLLCNVSENTVVFVNAPWGEGKTTFSQMWRAYLKQLNLEVIYFDAYAADYFDDPFVSFSGEILELVDKHFPEGKKFVERQEFKEKAAEVGKHLAGLAVKVGLRAVTFNLIQASDFAQLKQMSDELTAGISEVGADAVEKEIENHTTEKDALKKFKESLRKLAAKIRQEQGFPLTIIVDELDRCRPDFALGLLERIKHLFDVDGVAFVLLVNQEQIERYIRNVYGNDDADIYLHKFGSLFVDLPCRESLTSYEHQPGRKEYCHQLFNDFRFTGKVDYELTAITGALVVHFNLTLREIEKVFTVMVIYHASTPRDRWGSPFIVSLLSVLKIKQPLLYESLSKGKISADDFFKQTDFNELGLDTIRGLNLDWAKNFLNYCLLSEPDLHARPGLETMMNWAKGNRTKIIPQLCESLDRFSFQRTNNLTT